MGLTMRKMLAGVLLASCALMPSAYGEEEPPWTHPEVVESARNIALSAQQGVKFRGAVREFLQGFDSDVRRLLNSNNRSDLPRKIAAKRRARVKDMDEQVAEFLSPEQQAAYEVYRDLLLEKMNERAARRRLR